VLLVLQLLDQQERVAKKAVLTSLRPSVRVAIEGVKPWPLADEVRLIRISIYFSLSYIEKYTENKR
jgi:hypothetical protein